VEPSRDCAASTGEDRGPGGARGGRGRGAASVNPSSEAECFCFCFLRESSDGELAGYAGILGRPNIAQPIREGGGPYRPCSSPQWGGLVARCEDFFFGNVVESRLVLPWLTAHLHSGGTFSCSSGVSTAKRSTGRPVDGPGALPPR
jgi:hypothetical protein